jgi:hypothetical protein
MAATEPGSAPDQYTLRRLLKAYAWALVAGAIATVVLVAVIFGAIYWFAVWAPGPRAGSITSVVDDLRLAPGWTVEETLVKDRGQLDGCWRFLFESCPQVTRRYLVDADFPEAVAAAHEMVEGTGAVIDWESDPDCGTFESASRFCFLWGNVGDVRLGVNVYLPGEGDDGQGIARPDRVLVRLIATVEEPRATAAPASEPGASP